MVAWVRLLMIVRCATMPGKRKLYSPYQISNMSESAMRKAYSELRSIANKRLARLEKQGLGMTARTGYKFPTIRNIEESSKATIASELADVSKFLRDPRTTVSGEKQFLNNFREMMTEKGYSDLVETPDDIYKTLQFMEEIRDTNNNRLLPSGDVLDVLQQAERLKIPTDKLKDNIDIFVQHLDELEDVKPTKGGRTFSSQRLNALIRKWT